MGSRSGLAGLLRTTMRVTAAVERDRKRAVNTQARQQRMTIAQKVRDNKTAEKLEKADYLAGQQDEVDDEENQTMNEQ